MYPLLNLASLVLGLLSWALPGWLLACPERRRKKVGLVLVLSGTACALALLFQLVYSWHLVAIGDWSALMDTTGAVVKVSMVLVAVTAGLDALAAAACAEEEMDAA